VIWLICALYYIVSIGALGITSTLALRHLRWPDLVLWVGIGYMIVAAVLLFTHHTALQITSGSWWAILSGALAISGLIALYVGLQHGSAAKVVTVSAAYPAMTVLLAALFLSERLTVPHVLGVLFVVAGGVLISAF
jgi:bacterial/archaeal transporter family protein